MKSTFKGGLHVNDFKSITNDFKIKKSDGAKEHIFPMKQHIGAVLTPCVSKGDKVYVGTKLGDSDAFMSVPVHSSVSGTVSDILDYPHPGGGAVCSVVVENDFLYIEDESVTPAENIDTLSKEDMLKVIRDKGIVGMGGAGFPTFIKLNPSAPIDYVIVNGAECEPYITADHRRMLENGDEIISGLKLAMKVLGLSKGYIAIEDNKQNAIKVLSEKVSGDDTVEIKTLKTKYPQGAEKQLIKAVTNRQVPTGALPVEVGVVVLNVDTVYALHNAFYKGIPPVRRIVTLSGDCVKNPGNYEVPLGVTFEHMIELAGGYEKEPKKVIMGGPMMGAAQYSLEVPVIKTTSSILSLSDAANLYNEENNCIRCGKCVDYCPMSLMPLNLSRFVRNDNYEMAIKYHIKDCMECGLCSYVCPSGKNPSQFIRVGKQTVISRERRDK